MLNRSTITKYAAVAGVAGALIAGSAAPVLADAYGSRHYDRHHVYEPHPVGAAVGVIGGALAGATALAAAPFRGPYGGPYAYDREPGYVVQGGAYAAGPYWNPDRGQCATEGAQGRTWSVC
jgi:hypothetical protein